MGRVLYALLFVVLVPLGLYAWAGAVHVDLSTPRWPATGWMLVAAGVCLMLEAMRELWVRGRGLPMNAYPPERLVSTGVYGVVPHPIYAGFCSVCLGVSLATGSSGGLWLITPMVVIGCVALVLGYEGPALRARFGTVQLKPLLHPPEASAGAPSVRDRLSVFALLFVPWLVLYETWGHAQPAPLASIDLPGESHWPVFEWTTYIYSMAYPFTLSVPLLLQRRQDLRRFFDAGIVAVFITMVAYVVVPVSSPPRPFDPRAPGGWLLALEQVDGLNGAVALPSFHVVWVIISACAYARRGRLFGAVGWVCAIAISASCSTTGMHGVADIVAAAPIAVLAWRWPLVWAACLRGGERVANSWSCVRIGPMRIINYAAYAGLAAATGMLLALSLAGPEHGWRLAAIAMSALVCAAVWGQVLVGSATLLRPFGYFGSILGAAAGLAWIGLSQGCGTFWLLAGALTVSAPWVVVIGRMRCLVQGCCHGSPVQAECGIRYVHPLSRVCRVAHLKGIPVHPTPLYSMASNVVIGLVLARLWSGGAALSMISGVYLLLAGVTRFVEESRRGEPQTQIVAGLRIYQWFALVSVVAGACITTLPAPRSPGGMAITSAAIVWSVVIGAAYAFAMGMDFPDSNRRFSRLA